MPSFVQIKWNGVTVAGGRMDKPIKRTLQKVENSVKWGIRLGAKENIETGKKTAKMIIKANDSVGPHNVLFNSIRSDQRGKNYFYLIAGYGMGPRERYPLYIEKGFKPHFVPIAYIMDWLNFKASADVKEHAMSRGGMMVGTKSIWRTGLGYMDNAFGVMQANLNRDVTKSILKNLQKMRFR